MAVHSFTGDWSGDPGFVGVDWIDFISPDDQFHYVFLNASDFGAGKTADDLTLNASGNWQFGISVGAGETFSASNWNMSLVSFGLGITAVPDADVTINGSSHGDAITIGGSATMAAADVAIVHGGGGDDYLSVDPRSIGAGDVFDGGAGRDELYVTQEGVTSTDMRTVSLSDFEKLTLTGPGTGSRSWVFDGSQLTDVEEISVFANSSQIDVHGQNVDLSGIDLNGFGRFHIIGSGTTLNTLIGSPAFDNIFGAANAPNRIVSSGGGDVMYGGGMDDVFVLSIGEISDAGDVIGGGGFDTIELLAASGGELFDLSYGTSGVERVKFAGTASSTLLMANGDNWSDDTLSSIVGGAGTDTVRVTGSLINRLPNSDIDLSPVTFSSWGANDAVIVRLAYTGKVIGSNVADQIIATPGADLLEGRNGNDAITAGSGNDTLDGGNGIDTLSGGYGNDTYIDVAGDVVIELAGGGTDTAQSSATVSILAMSEIENVRLTGGGHVNAAGNAGANSLLGNAGNNILNGNGGTDTMSGGAGNDTYYVDSASDQIIENQSEGTDLISSSVSLTLISTIENLNLSGSANLQGNGNTGANRINGNGGDNILRGYEGADTLSGGGGNDILLGGTASDSLNPGSDTVRDIIRFSAAGESTGSQRDIVTGMDLDAEDVFDFTVVPGTLGSVSVGALSLATINADLAAAVNASLGVNGAVLFDPSTGDLNASGHVYLVVDGNGDGSYTPNQDYVVQLVNATGILSLDDFI